jgi:ligand-binding sensor domain-containing protein
MLKKKAVFLFIISILPQVIFCQFNHYKLLPLQYDDGSFKINCLFKSQQGYLYAGTTAGLLQFDGISFKKIKIIGSDVTDTVMSIYQDNKGSLWIGHKSGRIATGGINSLNYINPQEGLPKIAITCFLQDKQGNIWFGTNGEGIYYFYNTHLYLINDEEGLTDKYIHALALANNGDVLAATDQGINICTVNGLKKSVTAIGPKNGLPDYFTTGLTPAGNNTFWIAMQEKGVCLYNHNTKQVTVPAIVNNWQHGQVNTVIQATNNIWIATEQKGLFKLQKNLQSLHPITTGALQNNLSNIIEDNEGNMWMTSNTNLIATAADKITLLPLYDKTTYQTIHSILCDAQNNIWAGTNGGVIKYNTKNGTAKKITIKGLTTSTDVTGLYQDIYKNIWISTMGAGVFILNPTTGSYRNINENPLLKNASILSVTGNGSTVCMGGLEGVATIFELTAVNRDISSNYKFINYNNIPNIGNNYIHTVFKDNTNNIWFATDGKGITVLKNGKFINYNKTNGLADDVVYSFTEDAKGNIWFNTKDAGIYCFNGKQFKNYNLSSGLSTLKISALKTDTKNNIVLVHQNGIDVLNPTTGAITYMDNAQGLGNINSSLQATTVDTLGNVYLSAANGVLVYTPATNITATPITVIDEVQISLRSIDSTTHSFNHNQNDFTFNFTGLYYTNPEKIRYQYKLMGLDTNWITTKDRSVPFANLQPSTYTFLVRSSYTNNFSNSSQATYTFTIAKPLWKQLWFITLCVLAGAALLYWYIKHREKELKKIQQLQQEKIQFQFQVLGSQVNPHFLFNSFNTLISTIEDDPKTAVAYTEQLSDFFRNIVTYRDKDIVTLEEELQLLNTYFFLQQKRYGNNLQLHVNVSVQQKAQWQIPPLTLQLLMENAIKHNAVSKENTLLVEVYTDNNQLILRNNINIKRNQEASTGMGLQNITNRYKLLTQQSVQVLQNSQYFTVILPTIKNQ